MALWGEPGAMINAFTTDDLHMQFDVIIILSTIHVRTILSMQGQWYLRNL